MSKTKKAIVSVTNDLYTDQRVNKVCVFLMDQGYDVLLVGRIRKSSVPLLERPYQTKRMRLLFETGPLFYASFSIRLFLFLLFRKADVLVSNDLDTLLPNYLAQKFKRKARLVYDSHEYFTEVPELINRPKVQKFWLRIERKIFPRLKSVYTVNESIAAIYSKLYSKEIKVVRNISPLWSAINLKTKQELGIPENSHLIILQGAGINIDRGAEEAVEAMCQIDAVLLIVGDGDVVEILKIKVKKLELTKKVLFYGKKTYHVMMNFTHFADIGLTLDKPSNLNYKLSLPNKLFDYMHTYTAVVATNIKEVAQVVTKNEIGTIVMDFTVDNLAESINSILNDQQLLAQYKENCKAAALTENWQRETKILQEIYPKVTTKND
ncbi:glycosyltransferase [Crocinitomicaceae bacterium]|nr:glycosyltransferase [Crocinitomicaceae bacterium]